jgi:hypothetical protein
MTEQARSDDALIGAQYFRDVAAVVSAGGPPDRAKLLQVMARYGLQPAPWESLRRPAESAAGSGPRSRALEHQQQVVCRHRMPLR